MSNSGKLTTKPYKGTRDFYPQDWVKQQYIFKTWRRICRQFGFQEYMTPTIEDFELYAIKSSEELVTQQLFSFTDRGNRQVALRPEMTPSVARLVAARQKQLPKPIRWFSLANFFRYEQPQKGRLREFWQLNADIFGVDNITAEFEILQLNRAIMDAFGAQPHMYEVRINSRKLLGEYLGNLGNKMEAVIRVIDKKEKLTPQKFNQEIENLKLTPPQEKKLFSFLNLTLESLRSQKAPSPAVDELLRLFNLLEAAGIADNIFFSPTTVRGFAYYDGIVFEQFDLNPNNNRSMFGGGRYDGLLQIFGKDKFPAVGFAPGDVTTHEFLENWGLLPREALQTRPQVLVTVFPEDFERFFIASAKIAQKLRNKGIHTELILEKQSLSHQLDYANRRKIPLALVIGPEELSNNVITLKEMQSGVQYQLKIEPLIKKILKS